MDRNQSKAENPPFSRIFTIEALLSKNGKPMEIEADGAEKTAVAELFGIEAVGELRASFQVKAEHRQIHVKGVVTARVSQNCIVTLEPFEEELSEAIDVMFTEDPAEAASGSTPGNEADWGDPPDLIVNGQIDLGQLAAEHAAISLDPYPRKPGVVFDEATLNQAADPGDSPFDILRDFQPKAKK